MNKDESLALLGQGREAWNAWAQTMRDAGTALEGEEQAWRDAAQADFSGHTFAEDVDFSHFNFPGHARFYRATFEGQAEFGGATFSGNAEFGGATFSGNAVFGGARFEGVAVFGNARFESVAGFHSATFLGDAGFGSVTVSHRAWFCGATFSGVAGFGGGARFESDVEFGGATFSGNAEFGGATFSGNAVFGEARFESVAGFHSATFLGGAGFGSVTFSDLAGFGGATFSGGARFDSATFKNNTDFADARFENAAEFHAIDVESAFSLAGATFHAVPNFIQAHFGEAPRFDNTHIEPQRLSSWSLADVKRRFKGDPDRAACWRALKRLAIQSHDHGQELAFFKGETKARRWGDDKPWHALFWFGLFYQWLSDFGRSLLRPLLWWAASVAGFACLYLGRHPALANAPASGFDWAKQWFFHWVGGAPPHTLSCNAGPDEPWQAAFGISIRKGLLFLGQDSTALKRFHACLYETLSDIPFVPYEIIILGLVQNVISAVLIFLFLLAIRNHFRIK